MKSWKLFLGIIFALALGCYWGGQYSHNYIENMAQGKSEKLAEEKVAEAMTAWKEEASSRIKNAMNLIGDLMEKNCKLKNCADNERTKVILLEKFFAFILQNSDIPPPSLRVYENRKIFSPTQYVLLLDKNILFEEYESQRGHILDKFRSFGHRAVYIGQDCERVFVQLIDGPRKGECFKFTPVKCYPAQSAFVYSSSGDGGEEE